MEKKIGWVNVYRTANTDCIAESSLYIYSTKEEAIKHHNHNESDYIGAFLIKFDEFYDSDTESNVNKLSGIKSLPKDISSGCYSQLGDFHEGLATLQRISKSGRRECSVINKKGDVIVQEGIYDYIGWFSEGLAVVQKDLSYGYINKNGTVVIPLKYDYASSFSEGLAIIKFNNNWGYIDKEGNCTLDEISK